MDWDYDRLEGQIEVAGSNKFHYAFSLKLVIIHWVIHNTIIHSGQSLF